MLRLNAHMLSGKRERVEVRTRQDKGGSDILLSLMFRIIR